ncbi:MAG: PGF-pre-PGF domain-containing protein, partial [Nanoarchaeota archaeon]
GKFRWAAWANDTTGNSAFSTANRTITIDTVAPTIALPFYANGTLKKNTETLTLNVSVSDATTNPSACKIDINGTNQTVSVSSGWCNITNGFLTNLGDGNRTINVYANDSTGQFGLNNSFVVKIDSTAPVITLPFYVNGTKKTSTTDTLTLNVSVSDAGTSPSACKIDINGTNQTVSVSSGWCNITNGFLTNLGDGNRTINVYTNDTLNTFGINNSYVVFVDTTNPVAEFGTNPADNVNRSNTSVTFDLRGYDGVSLSYIALYGNWTGSWVANQTNTSPINATYWNITVDNIPQGKFRWAAWANDSHNNQAFSTANRTITIDTVAPTITNETAGSITSSTTTITWTTNESANSSVNYGTSTSLGTTTGSASLVTSHSVALSSLSASTLYYYNVTSCDPANNCNTTGPNNFTTSAAAATSGGGGGGGGVTSVNQTNVTTKQTNETGAGGTEKEIITCESKVTDIATDSTKVFREFCDETGIKEIEVAVNKSAQDVKITINKYDGLPAAVSVEKTGKVYNYLEINVENVLGKLDGARLKFSVEKNWTDINEINKEDVSIFKFIESESRWNELLSTTYTGSDDSYHNYITNVSDFSYFAIGESEEIKRLKEINFDLKQTNLVLMGIMGLLVLSIIIVGIFIRRRILHYKEAVQKIHFSKNVLKITGLIFALIIIAGLVFFGIRSGIIASIFSGLSNGVKSLIEKLGSINLNKKSFFYAGIGLGLLIIITLLALIFKSRKKEGAVRSEYRPRQSFSINFEKTQKVLFNRKTLIVMVIILVLAAIIILALTTSLLSGLINWIKDLFVSLWSILRESILNRNTSIFIGIGIGLVLIIILAVILIRRAASSGRIATFEEIRRKWAKGKKRNTGEDRAQERRYSSRHP